MSKQKSAAAQYPSFWSQLFQMGAYKSRQGRITRQVTGFSIGVIVLLSAYKLHTTLLRQAPALHYGLPLAFAVIGLWLTYRLVNMPRFADFLIAVEAEMKKVSWPTWTELVRSSMVVIFVIFSLALLLSLYDLLWQNLFSAIGLLEQAYAGAQRIVEQVPGQRPRLAVQAGKQRRNLTHYRTAVTPGHRFAEAFRRPPQVAVVAAPARRQ